MSLVTSSYQMNPSAILYRPFSERSLLSKHCPHKLSESGCCPQATLSTVHSSLKDDEKDRHSCETQDLSSWRSAQRAPGCRHRDGPDRGAQYSHFERGNPA